MGSRNRALTLLSICLLALSTFAAISRNGSSIAQMPQAELKGIAYESGRNTALSDQPSKDMEVDLTVYPDGTIGIDGKYNYTHMYPLNQGPLANATIGFSTSGDLTTGSMIGDIAPPETIEWPLNSTTASLSSQYSNGILTASLDASTSMAPQLRTNFPTNSSSLSFSSTYSNGMLNVKLGGNTTIPSYDTTFLFNVSDAVVLADYGGNMLRGNVTFRTVSGFPLGDVKVYFNGNKTDLYLTGNLTVVYGNYGGGMEINATILDQMLANYSSTIPGQGPESLYNMTWRTLECTQLNTTSTPIDSIGALVAYNVTIHGNFTDFFASLITQTSSDANYPELTRIFSAAIDSAFSSVQKGSLTMTYYHSTGIAVFDASLTCDVKALWSNALLVVPSTVPVENRTQVEAWLKIANATAYALKDSSFNASYSSVSYRLDVDASLSANATQLRNDAAPILPDAVPPQAREIVQSFVNTTYCELTSMSSTVNFANGIGSFAVNWTLEGDFKAEVNHAKWFFFDFLKAINPYMLGWEYQVLNTTEININNCNMELKLGNDSAYFAFNGLIVHPARDDIDFIRFKLYNWFSGMDVSGTPPQGFETLKVVVTAGFNGTHTILPAALGTVPSPNMTSLDYKTMMWENISMANLKDLLFNVAYQGVINYLGHTYYVPVFTNSTVSNFGLNPHAKSISLNVTGAAGTGFCNITIPRSLLYAAIGNWTVKIDGVTLPLTGYNVTQNAEYVFINLNYSHSDHTIEIVGTFLVPEFSPNTIVFTLISMTLIAAVIAVKHRKKPNASSSAPSFVLS